MTRPSGLVAPPQALAELAGDVDQRDSPTASASATQQSTAGRAAQSRGLTRPRSTPGALLTLRDQVIAPILAGVHSPRMGRKPAHWTRVDRHYEQIRIAMQTLFNDLAIDTPRPGG
jgi:hypothetical protein